MKTYWVTQKLPQTNTANHATFPIRIRKITVQICGNFWVTQWFLKSMLNPGVFSQDPRWPRKAYPLLILKQALFSVYHGGPGSLAGPPGNSPTAGPRLDSVCGLPVRRQYTGKPWPLSRQPSYCNPRKLDGRSKYTVQLYPFQHPFHTLSHVRVLELTCWWASVWR